MRIHKLTNNKKKDIVMKKLEDLRTNHFQDQAHTRRVHFICGTWAQALIIMGHQYVLSRLALL